MLDDLIGSSSHRMENEPSATTTHFKYINLIDWYGNAISWAKSNNIV